MKKHIRLSAVAIGLLLVQYTYAQATPPEAATKPENATALCKDGTYSTEANKGNACRGHHGIKDWYIPAPASASPEPPSETAAPPPVPPTVPPPAPATPSPTTQARTQSQAAAQSAAESGTPPPTQSINKGPEDTAETAMPPGGGPGLVWLNKNSHIYHCRGTRYYGKTKSGEFMTEADAKAKGAHRARGEVCHL